MREVKGKKGGDEKKSGGRWICKLKVRESLSVGKNRWKKFTHPGDGQMG